jgi:hypothetical protein
MGREELQLRARWLSHWCGMVTRIEPTTGSTLGAPDVHLANESVDGFLEFKIVEPGGTFDIRQNQVVWHSRYVDFKSNSGFCVMCPQGFWMMPSKAALQLGRVIGEPFNWEAVRSSILTFALRRIFLGKAFNRDAVEHLIEPLAFEGVG